jgi:hypothetical protein
MIRLKLLNLKPNIQAKTRRVNLKPANGSGRSYQARVEPSHKYCSRTGAPASNRINPFEYYRWIRNDLTLSLYGPHILQNEVA